MSWMLNRDSMILGDFSMIFIVIYVVACLQVNSKIVCTLCLWILITWATVIKMLWFLSHMVDDLECFVLVIFVQFMVACAETGLSSQTKRFLGSLLSDIFIWIFLLVRGFCAQGSCAFFSGFSGTCWAPMGAQFVGFGLELARSIYLELPCCCWGLESDF